MTPSYTAAMSRVRGGLWFAFGLALSSCGLVAEMSDEKGAAAVGDLGKPTTKPESTPSPDAHAPSVPLVAHLGDIGLARVDVPGFGKLDLADKRLIYYYYLAALAGDAIQISSSGKGAMAVKRLLDGILGARQAIDGPLIAKIEPYALRFYINHGPRDWWTGEKHRPEFILGELAAAAERASEKGADIGVDRFEGADLGANHLEQLDALLRALMPIMYEQRATEGKTPEQASEKAEQEDAGRTQKAGGDLGAAFPKRARWMTGDFTRVASLLSGVLPSVAADDKALIEALIAFYETGDDGRLNQPMTRWLDQDAKVAFAMGSLAPSREGEGGQAGFEAMVAVRDDDQTPLLRKVTDEAAYFERHLPGNAMFRRPRKEVVRTNAGVYTLVAATGAAGPIARAWLDLPVPFARREGLTQRSLLFSNLLEASERVYGDKLIREFAIDAESMYRRVKWRTAGLRAFIILKHVVGYTAGMRKSWTPSAGAVASLAHEADVSVRLLDELQSDLIALYYIFDEKATSLGLVPEEECATAIMEEYVSALISDTVCPGIMQNLEPEARLARQLIVRHALAKGAVEVVNREGRFFARVADVAAMKGVVDELLEDAVKMSATGDMSALKTLMEDYGGPLPAAWRKDAARRFEKLGLPQHLAFIFPALEPMGGDPQAPSDIALVHPANALDALMRKAAMK